MVRVWYVKHYIYNGQVSIMPFILSIVCVLTLSLPSLAASLADVSLAAYVVSYLLH